MIPMRSRTRRAAALGVDAILAVLAPLIVRGSRRVAIPSSPRVLVVRCDHIGDAAMATAVLRPLRDVLRPSTLDVLAGPWAADVFDGHPAVDHVITCATPWWSAARNASLIERATRWAQLPSAIRRIRAGRYDVGIDLRGDLRQIFFFLCLGGIAARVSSDRTGGRRLLTHVQMHDASLHEVEKNFAVSTLLGVSGSPHLDVAAGAELSERVRTLLPHPHASSGFVVLALRASAVSRSWPVDRAAAVVDEVRRQCGLGSVIVGSAADAPFGDAVAAASTSPLVNLSGRTSLRETIAVLRRAVAVIAVDSGPMHLTAAVGVPVVALFGPSDPQTVGPWSDRMEVVTVGSPCGCAGPRCDFCEGPGRCMRAIDGAAVIEALRRVIAQPKNSR